MQDGRKSIKSWMSKEREEFYGEDGCKSEMKKKNKKMNGKKMRREPSIMEG